MPQELTEQRGEGQEEVWKSVVGYEGFYEVSSLGRVRGIERKHKHKNTKYFQTVKGRILCQSPHKLGYLMVMLSKYGKANKRLVNRVVAKSFLGVCSKQVNHKDCDKRNNKIDNLEYVSALENMIHARKNGMFDNATKRGESNSSAKLSNEEVGEIRKLYSLEVLPTSDIAKIFNVSRQCIIRIVRNETWRHLL